jgi:hypothetical protein
MLKSKQDGRAHVRPMSSLYFSYPAILPPSSCAHQTPQKLPPRRAESFAPREAELELASQGIMGNPVALAKPDSVCVCAVHIRLIKSHQISSIQSSKSSNHQAKSSKSSSQIIMGQIIRLNPMSPCFLVHSSPKHHRDRAQLGCPTPATSCFSSCGARSRVI